MCSCRKNAKPDNGKTYCNNYGGRDNGKKSHKIWINEAEEDLSIMGIKTGGQWPETVGEEWRKIVLEAKSHTK